MRERDLGDGAVSQLLHCMHTVHGQEMSGTVTALASMVV